MARLILTSNKIITSTSHRRSRHLKELLLFRSRGLGTPINFNFSTSSSITISLILRHRTTLLPLSNRLPSGVRLRIPIIPLILRLLLFLFTRTLITELTTSLHSLLLLLFLDLTCLLRRFPVLSLTSIRSETIQIGLITKDCKLVLANVKMGISGAFYESRNRSFSKDPGSGRELEVIKSRGEWKGDENYMREDEKLRKQKIADQNGSKERDKELKSTDKTKESDSRKKSSHHYAKDDKKDASRSNRASAKEGVGRKREWTKEDRSRHKRGSDSSRYKRRRSLSISSRGRKSKDSSSDHANESRDETSDGSKRKSRSRKQSSPSPIKSRRRQVSRSPHSKHSQRRHSPYSSETYQGKEVKVEITCPTIKVLETKNYILFIQTGS